MDHSVNRTGYATCGAVTSFFTVIQGRAERAAPSGEYPRTRHGGKVGAHSKSGRNAPTGTRRTTRRPLALPRQRTAAAAELRTPGSSPHRLSAATRRAYPNAANLTARPFLKPTKIAVKAVCDRRTTGDGQDHQVMR